MTCIKFHKSYRFKIYLFRSNRIEILIRFNSTDKRIKMISGSNNLYFILEKFYDEIDLKGYGTAGRKSHMNGRSLDVNSRKGFQLLVPHKSRLRPPLPLPPPRGVDVLGCTEGLWLCPSCRR